MANQGALHMNVVNARAAGSKDRATGKSFGGIYFPKHIDRNGVVRNAHWEGQFFINQLPWTDAEGVKHEAKNIPMRISAWNGKNAADGKGLADIFAKCVSTGKELSAVLRMDFFEKRIFINDVAQKDGAGQDMKYPAYGWVIKSDLQWGQDSGAVIATECLAWGGHSDFNSRPPQWNVQGTGDNVAWKKVVAERMATLYQGEAVYGYARVIVPEGATLVNHAGQPIVNNVALGVNAGIVGSVPTPPAGNVPAPPVTTGPTYAALIGAGWTPAQIAADPRYAALPTTAATGLAPGATPLNTTGGL